MASQPGAPIPAEPLALMELVECECERALESIVRTLRELEESLGAATAALARVESVPSRLTSHSVARVESGEPEPWLTHSECETLALFARGMSFDTIAQVRGVKLSTVRAQTKSARAKLEVTSTAQAAAKARQLGLITSG